MEPVRALEERRLHLLDYWRIVRRHRWIILSAFTLVVASGIVYSFLSKPIYLATSQIEIGSKSLKLFSAGEAVQWEPYDPEYLQTHYERLRNPSFWKKVVERMKQDRKDLWTRELDLSPSIFPIKGSRLVNINVESRDPHLAAMAANTMAQTYIDWDMEMKASSSQAAVKWLTSQIEDQRKKAENARAALEAFKQEKGLVMANEESQNINPQRVSALDAEYLSAQTRRVEAETRFNQVSSLLENPERLAAVSEVIKDPMIQTLRTQEVKLSGDLSELSLKYGPKHPQIVRLKAELNSIRQKISQEVKKIVISLKNDYEVARAREATLLKALNRQKAEYMDLSQKSVQYGVLKREMESADQIYQTLLTRLREADFAQDIKESSIQIVNLATVPPFPYKPDHRKNIFVSLVLAMLVGIGLAFFFEYLDNTLKTPDDVKEHLDLPFLGMVPHMGPSGRSSNSQSRARPDLLISRDPHSSAAESYHMVRTNLMVSSSAGPPQILLVTSPAPKEGKTVTSANLAIAMAQAGASVLLIDGDFRRPQIHHFFGGRNQEGLSNYLTGNSLLESLIRTTPVPNLKIMTSGPIPPNPAELLSSTRLAEGLAHLRKQFQAILFDSPPVAVVTDPVLLSQLADGTVLVIKSGQTYREVSRMAKEQLQAVNAPILGVVLNDVEVNREGYYYHYYGRYYHHYYGPEDGGRAGTKKTKAKAQVKVKAKESRL